MCQPRVQRTRLRRGATLAVLEQSIASPAILLDKHAVPLTPSIYGLDPNARIYLFGSRVYDDKRGGDIDLLILSEKLTSRDVSKIRIQLENHLGLRRIDLLIRKNLDSTFAHIARDEGVLL